MKRIVSIFLIVLLLLNVMGFYGIFLGVKYSNTQQLISDFDNDEYSHMQTVVFKIAVSVPYVTETEYQRVDGEIEHDGDFYRVVKQRYANDSLYIVCVRDVESKHISQALSDYVKSFTDHPSHQSQGKVISTFIKEYLISEINLGNASSGWSYGLTASPGETDFSDISRSILSPPPKA